MAGYTRAFREAVRMFMEYYNPNRHLPLNYLDMMGNLGYLSIPISDQRQSVFVPSCLLPTFPENFGYDCLLYPLTRINMESYQDTSIDKLFKYGTDNADMKKIILQRKNQTLCYYMGVGIILNEDRQPITLAGMRVNTLTKSVIHSEILLSKKFMIDSPNDPILGFMMKKVIPSIEKVVPYDLEIRVEDFEGYISEPVFPERRIFGNPDSLNKDVRGFLLRNMENIRHNCVHEHS